MSQSSIQVFTCDRCGRTEELRDLRDGNDWGKIIFAQANGPRWVGSQHYEGMLGKSGKDLCPVCMVAVHEWFKAGAAS